MLLANCEGLVANSLFGIGAVLGRLLHSAALRDAIGPRLLLFWLMANS